MKTFTVTNFYVLLFMVSGWIGTNAQTVETEVPGDNFSLEGALELFKKSASPEEFERLLNSPDSRVNNLDLNGDNRIDYIRVIDRDHGNVHLFVIQAVLSPTESQDVAVIELEKLGNGKAVLQITGDADVYGMETIIEPTREVRVNAGTMTSYTVVNVWAWPAVQFVYGPYYSVWISPWRWTYYPVWWHPWRPVAFHVYDPWWHPYRSHYAVCYSHRIGYLPRYYRPYRSHSLIVYSNYHHQIERYRANNRGPDRHAGRIVSSRDQYNSRSDRSRDQYRNTLPVSSRGRVKNNREDNHNLDRRQTASHHRVRGNVDGAGDNTLDKSTSRSSSPVREKGNHAYRSTPDFKNQRVMTRPEKRELRPNTSQQDREYQSEPSFNEGSRGRRSSQPQSTQGSGNKSAKPSGGRKK